MGFKTTCISLALGGVVGVGTMFVLDIKDSLKAEAKYQETIDNIKSSENNIEILVETLKSQVNEYVTYPVLYSSATFKNYNEYKTDTTYAKNIFTGETLKNPFNKEEDWVLSDPTVWTYAEAAANFTHEIDLTDLRYNCINNKNIIVTIPKEAIRLNEDSVTLDMLSYRECDAEEVDGEYYENGLNSDARGTDFVQNATSENSSIKTEALQAWQVKFIEDAPAKINELYATDAERQEELYNGAKESVEKLLNTILIDVIKTLGENSEVELTFVLQ
jgi:hypothetical protein